MREHSGNEKVRQKQKGAAAKKEQLERKRPGVAAGP
jgi:hypothetical protein